MELAMPICDVYWLMEERVFKGPFSVGKLRAWREQMRFRGGLNITVTYTEKDNPHMFNKEGAKNPGGVIRILSASSAQFGVAGILKVNVRAAKDVDVRASTEDFLIIADIFNKLNIWGEERSINKKKKDTRPWPDFDARKSYENKIRELVPTVDSNREIGRLVVEWAEVKSKNEPNKFGRFRVLSRWTLAKKAGDYRLAWHRSRKR